MKDIFNKFLIILISVLLFYSHFNTTFFPVFFLSGVLLNFSKMLWNNLYYKAAITGLYIIFCFNFPILLIVFPLFAYDLFSELLQKQYSKAFSPIAFFAGPNLTIIVVSAIAVYLSYLQFAIGTSDKNGYLIWEEMSEKNTQLKLDKNQIIQTIRQKEHLTTLEERNRISGQVHNSVGHTVSSSILQAEALKTMTSDINILNGLSLLQKNLQNGMAEIRNVLHGIKDESVNLKDKITKILQDSQLNFQLSVRDCSQLDFSMKYEIYFFVKECVNNTIKHSDADEITVKIIEQNNFVTVLIKDNGTKHVDISKIKYGIGLLSIDDMCNKHQGHYNISWDNGFKIFINIKKERS